MKVFSGRSSNPTSGVFFKVIYFHMHVHYSGLIIGGIIIIGVGSNPKLVTFSLLAN